MLQLPPEFNVDCRSGLCGSRHLLGATVHLPEALVIEEEEGLVSAVVKPGNAHWSADTCSEVVLGVDGLRVYDLAGLRVSVVTGPAVGIQDAVLEQIVSRAVKRVRSLLGDEIDHAAAGASKLGVEGVGHDLELGDGLDAEVIGDLHVGRGELGGGAVEQDVFAARLSATEFEVSGGWRGGVVAHGAGESGRERREFQRVADLAAEGQRKRFQHLGRHGEADIGGFGLQMRSVAVHGHRSIRGTDLQLSIDGGSAANEHVDADLPVCLKAGSVHFQCVISRRKLGKREQALRAGLAVVGASRLGLLERDGRTWDHGAICICYGAG